jgi:hypothetical protein
VPVVPLVPQPDQHSSGGHSGARIASIGVSAEMIAPNLGVTIEASVVAQGIKGLK